jgi:GNAT superfamily N-acetyltransferase
MIQVCPAANPSEEQASLDVYNAVWPREAITMAEVESFRRSMLDYVDLLARIDGEPAGSGVGAVGPYRPDLVTAIVAVLPERRRRGIGTSLYEAISAWGAKRNLDRIVVRVSDDDPESLGFATKRGFQQVTHEKGLVLDLAEIEPPTVELPDGVELVTWAERPGIERGLYEVALEAYPDIPGQENDAIEPFENWLDHEMRGSGDLPEATFVALAGNEVIGYSKFSLTAAQPKSAFHDLTAVKRAWRGRGLAGALKAAQIRWAKDNGYEELRTRNEERNEPIRRLNARLGYRPTPGLIFLEGPLSGA